MGITKFIFEKLMGWHIDGAFDPKVKKAVIIVVPHTSWYDFYLGLFIRRLTKTQINYIAKKELFRWPFGWYFRWTGGEMLDRTPRQTRWRQLLKSLRIKKSSASLWLPKVHEKKY